MEEGALAGDRRGSGGSGTLPDRKRSRLLMADSLCGFVSSSCLSAFSFRPSSCFLFFSACM